MSDDRPTDADRQVTDADRTPGAGRQPGDAGGGFGRLAASAGRVPTWLAVTLVALAGLAVRLVELGARIFHWDEGRVGYWAYRFHETGQFTYRPIIHGPFLPVVDNAVFDVLGATDFAARLPVAVVGGLVPLVALALRTRLSRRETIALAVILAADPLLVYYSRFMRSDVLVGTFAFAAFALAVAAIDRRQGPLFVPAAGLLALAFTAKENALVYVVCLLGASVVIVDHRLVRTASRTGSGVDAAVEAGLGFVRAADRWSAGGRLRGWASQWFGRRGSIAVHLGVWIPVTLFAAGGVAVGVFAFFYAPRPAIWQAIGGSQPLGPVIEAGTIGAVERFTERWVTTSHGNPYPAFLSDLLVTLAYGSGITIGLAVIGFLADGYGVGSSEPRRPTPQSDPAAAGVRADGGEPDDRTDDEAETGERADDEAGTADEAGDEAETGERADDEAETGERADDEAETGERADDEAETGERADDEAETGERADDEAGTADEAGEGREPDDPAAESDRAGDDTTADAASSKTTDGPTVSQRVMDRRADGTSRSADTDEGKPTGSSRVDTGGGTRTIVAFATYWAIASVIGYPVATDIQAPWVAVHAVVPLAIPAAVGLVTLVDLAETTVTAGEAVDAALAIGVLLAATGGAVGANADYWNAAGAEDRAILQWAQPDNDLKETVSDVRLVAGTTEGTDVLYVGTKRPGTSERLLHVPNENATAQPPPPAGWFGRLPLPWYFATSDVQVTSTRPEQRFDNLPADPPPVVIAYAWDADELSKRLAGYEARTHDFRLWRDEVTVFIDRDALEGAVELGADGRASATSDPRRLGAGLTGTLAVLVGTAAVVRRRG